MRKSKRSTTQNNKKQVSENKRREGRSFNLIDRYVSISIRYILVLADDDPMKVSPLQGFSLGHFDQVWALRQLVFLPPDLLEVALPTASSLIRRAGGEGGWSWAPLAVRALLQIDIGPEDPFWVIFPQNEKVRATVTAWADRQTIRPLIVPPREHPPEHPGQVDAELLSNEMLREYIAKAMELTRRLDPSINGDLATECIAAWSERSQTPAPIPHHGHNVVMPNIMTLEGAGYTFSDVEDFGARKKEEYISIIMQSARAVMEIRRHMGFQDVFRDTPPVPDIIITAPSLYRYMQTTSISGGSGASRRTSPAQLALTLLQRQDGYTVETDNEVMTAVMSSSEGQGIIRLRQQEVLVHTLAVGLRAASTLAATIRLPPSVNRATGALRHLATHTRAGGPTNPRKMTRLFSAVQEHLRKVVGDELLSVIAQSSSGIKLVTDAPLEWLPINGFPLTLRFDVSRINSTPGNLMVGELVARPIMRLRQEAFREVLIVSAFAADDPIRDVLTRSLGAGADFRKGKVTVRHVKVQTTEEFIEALNGFRGALMIFDGHGDAGDETTPGALIIAGQRLDVWGLRGRVRVPPIVVLSACDTMAVDASHASVANGFLAIGARTVVGTLLPVNSLSAASFAVRLLYRLADFLPAALATYGRAIRWTEVISGMLRMQFLTDVLNAFRTRREIDSVQWGQIHGRGNIGINSLNPNWMDQMMVEISEASGLTPAVVLERCLESVPLSDAVRYVQVGNPESLLIDNDSRINGERPAEVWERGARYE